MMKRVIKCRGWSRDLEKWIYGTALDLPSGATQIIFFGEDGHIYNLPVAPKTIGQFTGMHDEEGKEIYEGDILEVDWFEEEMKMLGEENTKSFVAEVVWVYNSGGFMMQGMESVHQKEGVYDYFVINEFNVNVIGNNCEPEEVEEAECEACN